MRFAWTGEMPFPAGETVASAASNASLRKKVSTSSSRSNVSTGSSGVGGLQHYHLFISIVSVDPACNLKPQSHTRGQTATRD
jgi:hypothetical protein